jgi:hypothetical protein
MRSNNTKSTPKGTVLVLSNSQNSGTDTEEVEDPSAEAPKTRQHTRHLEERKEDLRKQTHRNQKQIKPVRQDVEEDLGMN